MVPKRHNVRLGGQAVQSAKFVDRSRFASQVPFSSESYNKRFIREMVKKRPRNMPFIDPAPTRQGGATVNSLEDIHQSQPDRSHDDLRASLGLKSHASAQHAATRRLSSGGSMTSSPQTATRRLSSGGCTTSSPTGSPVARSPRRLQLKHEDPQLQGIRRRRQQQRAKRRSAAARTTAETLLVRELNAHHDRARQGATTPDVLRAEPVPITDPWEGQHVTLTLSDGLLLAKKGEFVEAIDRFTQALDVDAANALAAFNRGLASMQLGRYTGAIDDFSRCMRIGPPKPSPFFNRALCHAQLGDDAAAVADFTRAITLSPGTVPELFVSRALAHRRLGNFVEAQKDYMRVRKKEGGSSVNGDVADGSDLLGDLMPRNVGPVGDGAGDGAGDGDAAASMAAARHDIALHHALRTAPSRRTPDQVGMLVDVTAETASSTGAGPRVSCLAPVPPRLLRSLWEQFWFCVVEPGELAFRHEEPQHEHHFLDPAVRAAERARQGAAGGGHEAAKKPAHGIEPAGDVAAATLSCASSGGSAATDISGNELYVVWRGALAVRDAEGSVLGAIPQGRLFQMKDIGPRYSSGRTWETVAPEADADGVELLVLDGLTYTSLLRPFEGGTENGEAIEALEASGLCDSGSPASVADLLLGAERVSFSAGEQIVTQDDVATHFYVLLKGTVAVTKVMREVHKTTDLCLHLTTLSPFDIFGEAAVISLQNHNEGEEVLTAISADRYPSNVTCSTAVSVLRLPKTLLSKFEWDATLIARVRRRAFKYQADSKLIQVIRDKRKWLQRKGQIITEMVKCKELNVGAKLVK